MCVFEGAGGNDASSPPVLCEMPVTVTVGDQFRLDPAVSGGTVSQYRSLVPLPAWLVLDAKTGTLRGHPPTALETPLDFLLVASAESGDFAMRVIVNVDKRAPAAAAAVASSSTAAAGPLSPRAAGGKSAAAAATAATTSTTTTKTATSSQKAATAAAGVAGAAATMATVAAVSASSRTGSLCWSCSVMRCSLAMLIACNHGVRGVREVDPRQTTPQHTASHEADAT